MAKRHSTNYNEVEAAQKSLTGFDANRPRWRPFMTPMCPSYQMGKAALRTLVRRSRSYWYRASLRRASSTLNDSSASISVRRCSLYSLVILDKEWRRRSLECHCYPTEGEKRKRTGQAQLAEQAMRPHSWQFVYPAVEIHVEDGRIPPGERAIPPLYNAVVRR